jgi:hypothetical protein
MLGHDYPNPQWGISALDCDGDGVADLVIDRGWLDQPARKGVYLYRSGTGRSMRTRALTMDDADRWFEGSINHGRGGGLNDRSRRFESLCIMESTAKTDSQPRFYVFSGGSDGPDPAYDAWCNFPFNGVPLGSPIDDVDGDGWSDYLCGDPLTYAYSFRADVGTAVIFAGGPYIPGPKISGVDAIASQGHAHAVTVWPSPAHDELHIAWRGDLKRMPHTFVVHDLLGREVARGDVREGAGAALWHCGDVAAGIYLLSINDMHGELIATMKIIRE